MLEAGAKPKQQFDTTGIAPVRQPEIHRLVAELARAVEELNGSVDSVHARLEPVMSPEFPTEAGESGSQIIGTDLGGRLNNLLNEVRRANAHLQNVHSRVEL